MPRQKKVAPTFVLDERYDIDAAKKFAAPNAPNAVIEREDGDIRAYRALLRKYPDGVRPISYTAPAFGRFHCEYDSGTIKPSVLLKRFPRAELSWSIVWDYDMQSAHANFMYQYAARFGLKKVALEGYVREPKRWRNGLAKMLGITAEEAKGLFNALPNGKSIEYWCFQHGVELSMMPPDIHLFKEEAEGVYEHIWKDPANAALKAYKLEDVVVAGRAENRQKVSVGSTFFQDLERRAVTAAVHEAREGGWKVDAIIYDGFHVGKVAGMEEVPAEVTAVWEDAALEKTGYRIKLVKKEFERDPQLVQDLEVAGVNTTPVTIEKIFDDVDAARVLYQLMDGDRYIRNVSPPSSKDGPVMLIYDIKTGMWTKDAKLTITKRAATMFRDELLSEPNERGVCTNYGGKTANMNQMMQAFVLVPECDPGFAEQRLDTSLDKLLFSDCIYDMKTGETSAFDPDIFFVDRIDRPYSAAPDPDKKARVHKLLFEDPYTPRQIAEGVPEYVKGAMASMLRGNYRARASYWLLGGTASSKGVLTGAALASCGSYFATFNADSLKMLSFAGDGAKEKSWMIPIAQKRGVFSNEVRASVEVNSDLFKMMVSGGDEITVRSNNVDEFKLIMRCVPMFLANDMLQFNPLDDAVEDRIHGVVDMKVRFVNADKLPGGVATDVVKEKDPDVKDLFKEDDYKDAFLGILLDAARKEGALVAPPSVIQSKADWIEDALSFESLLKRKFEVTGSKEDFVPVDVALKYFKEANFSMSPHKLKEEMAKMSGVTHTGPDPQWVPAYKRKMRGFWGLRMVMDDDVRAISGASSFVEVRDDLDAGVVPA